MRIAQIAPLFETVPPRRYGGTERVVHWLTEELVAMGHEVTLFAAGDSQTNARLVAARDRAARFVSNFEVNGAPYMRMLEMVRREAREFDVLHFHIDFWPLSLFSRQATPFLTTLHGRMDQDWVQGIYGMFPETHLVSISDSQRQPAPNLGWLATVLHGMPRDLLRPAGEPRGYLAFLGRMSPEKGIADALAIARAADMPIKIAAKIGEEDRLWYEAEIAPHLGEPGVDYVGEIEDGQKSEFLSGAAAVLLPIAWPEPFGLVMIEAMACGCPTIAYRRGSVPEVLEEGVTGCIVGNVAEAVAAIPRATALDRAAIRAEFERHWTARRMAEEYVGLYQRLSAGL